SRLYFRSRFGIFIPEARSFFKYAFSARRSSISFSNCCFLVSFLSVFFFGFLDIDGRPFVLESPSIPLLCHNLYHEYISECSGISKFKAIIFMVSSVLNLYSMSFTLNCTGYFLFFFFPSNPFLPYFKYILTHLRILDSLGTPCFLASVR